MTPFLDGTYAGLLLTGIALGGILGALAIGVGQAVPRWRGSVGIPLGGLALALPLAIVATGDQSLPTTVLAGLGMLLVTGFLVPRRAQPLVHGAASIPGAVVLAIGTEEIALLLVVMITPILVTAVAMFGDGHDYEHGLATICAAIAGGGAFLTVPDTEHAAVLAGAGAAVGLVVFVQPRLALQGSAMVWCGAFVWTVAVDGAPRATSIVGALGALGVLAIDPAVRSYISIHRGLLTYLPTQGDRSHLIITAFIQTTIAMITARIAGLSTNMMVAIAITVGTWALVGAGLTYRAKALQPPRQ